MRPYALPLVSLVRRGPRAQLLVLEAMFSLLLAFLRLKTCSFARIARQLGVFVAPGDPRAGGRFLCPRPDQVRAARRVGWAVRSTAALLPSHFLCLHQAMAAHAMLRRRGIACVVHFGRGPEPPFRDGHAWLDAAGVGVTGYPVDPAIAELGCLV